MIEYLLAIGNYVCKDKEINFQNQEETIEKVAKLILPFIEPHPKIQGKYRFSSFIRNIVGQSNRLALVEATDINEASKFLSQRLIDKAKTKSLGSTVFPMSVEKNESPNYFPNGLKLSLKEEDILKIYLSYTKFLFSSRGDKTIGIAFYSSDEETMQILKPILTLSSKEDYKKNFNYSYEFLSYLINERFFYLLLEEDIKVMKEKLKGKIYALIIQQRRMGSKIDTTYDIIIDIDFFIRMYLNEKLWKDGKDGRYHIFGYFVESLVPIWENKNRKIKIRPNDMEKYCYLRNRFLFYLYHNKDFDFNQLLQILDIKVFKDESGLPFTVEVLKELYATRGKTMSEGIYNYGLMLGKKLREKDEKEWGLAEYYKLRNKPSPSPFIDELTNFIVRLNKDIIKEDKKLTVHEQFIEKREDINEFNQLKTLFLVGLVNGIYSKTQTQDSSMNGGEQNEGT